MECRICGNVKQLETFEVREMMFGNREKFDYFLCKSCTTLQIKNIPINLSNYYPKDYYSLSANQTNEARVELESSFSLLVFLKWTIKKIFTPSCSNPILDYIMKFISTSSDRILDIGCGKGVILGELYNLQYKNLMGVDPYLPHDISVENNYWLLKKDILSLDGKWDLIMLHHVFEHLVNPKEILHHLNSLLTENGKILIRVPNVDSYAWHKYSTNWVQIDAPRHIHVFSPRSIGILAKECGLRVANLKFDSILFQFWGSEQCRQNISLHDPASYAVNPSIASFSTFDFLRFRLYTFISNFLHKGDQFAIVLEKSKQEIGL